MPCVIRISAITVVHAAAITAATAARRILTLARDLLVRGFGLWFWLIGPSCWPHVLGENFLARGASVVVVVVVHHFKIIADFKIITRKSYSHLLREWFGLMPARIHAVKMGLAIDALTLPRVQIRHTPSRAP